MLRPKCSVTESARTKSRLPDQDILPNKAGGPGKQRCKNDFCRQHIVQFREFPECTVDPKAMWKLFKAPVASPAAQECRRKLRGVANLEKAYDRIPREKL